MAPVSKPIEEAKRAAICARRVRGNVCAGAVLRQRVAVSHDLGGFRMDGDQDFFLVERFEVSRGPVLHRTIALEQLRCRGNGPPFQEILAREIIVAAPVRRRDMSRC